MRVGSPITSDAFITNMLVVAGGRNVSIYDSTIGPATLCLTYSPFNFSAAGPSVLGPGEKGYLASPTTESNHRHDMT